MEDRSHALIALAFLVVFGVGAGLVTWWMMTPTATRVPYILESDTSVAGLGPGSPVNYRGVQVGAVRKVGLQPKQRRVEVRIVVNKNFPLPKGTYAAVSAQGLIGNKSIELKLGRGDTMIETSRESPAHLQLKSGSLAALMEQAGDIVTELRNTLQSVQQLFSKQNRVSLSRTLANIEQASARLVALEKAARPGVKAIPGVLAEARKTLAHARQLLGNAERLVAAAQGPVHAIGHAASSTGALMAQVNQTTAPQMSALLVRLRALSQRLERLSAELQRTPQSLVVGPAPAHPGPGENGKHAGQGG